MFESATFKLTLSYLAIIMVLCLMFSSAIYGFATNELERGLARQTQRLNNVYPEFNFNPALRPEIDYSASSRRILLNLVYLNLIVLVAAGVASYALARWTLQPIEAAHEQQKRFTADVSHELRTPLTSLKMTTEVALMDTTTTKTNLRKALQSNLEDATKIDILINNLLRLTRLEATELQHQFAPVPVSMIVDESIASLADAAAAKKINIQFEQGSKLKVLGDHTSLVQLLTILLDNAIKYSPVKSTITICAETEGSVVILTVADNGPGIDAVDLPHIFDRFYRADAARSAEANGGFGLGLSIAKMISDLHDGELTLKSEPGKGTTAYLSLPAAKA